LYVWEKNSVEAIYELPLQMQKPLHTASMQPINLHHRKSIRLKEYDYSSPGEYFVTICANHREWLFGDITSGEMHLNPLGLIVQEEWVKTAEIHEDVELDSFVVMPNHIHGIITLIESGRGTSQRADVGANCNSPHAKSHNNPTINGAYIDTPLQKTKFYSPSGTIGAIIRGFKSASTKRINLLRSTPRQPIWQRNYSPREI
jgi:putative transposase